MWLPRPITHRFPSRRTGAGPRSCPGAMPAHRVTFAASMVESPTSIQRSPYTDPVGNAIIEPGPKAANLRLAADSAVMVPARSAKCQAPWIRLARAALRHVASARLHDMADHGTPRAARVAPRTRAEAGQFPGIRGASDA